MRHLFPNSPESPNLPNEPVAPLNDPPGVAESAATLPSSPVSSALIIALLGTLSLCVAMGMGRFAFTPLLPLMLRDGSVTLAQGSWLATTNYLGYFVGAAVCAALPGVWRRLTGQEAPADRLASAGLLATWLLLLVMALPLPSLWPTARFLAGMASAFAFVFVSAWCMPRLALGGGAQLAGLIYTGPGVGILLSGLGIGALSALGGHATLGWCLLALVAVPVLWWIRGVLRRESLHEQALRDGRSPPVPPHPAVPVGAGTGAGIGEAHPAGWDRESGTGQSRQLMAWMVLGYGLAGFGYIITATFLPVLARDALPGSAWVDLFWPLYGLAVIAGCLLAMRIPLHWDNRVLMIVCYLLQAVGVILGLWWPSVPGFALGSVLVGLPFTALTLFAVREIRLRWPHHAAALIALITASYAIGQILGPPLVNWLLHHTESRAQGFAMALSTASAALLIGAAIWSYTLRFSRPGPTA